MMANNMFSMFDPSSSYMSYNWLIMSAILLVVKTKKFKKKEKFTLLIGYTLLFISKEVKQMINKKTKISNTMFLTVFFVLLVENLMAIFPYNFTPTAHMSISFTMSASMWVATMVFGWKNHFKTMMIHLTPLGTPNALMNFMVMIETISAIIRPITLSIRLSANMVAGHLLMTLLSSFSMSSTMNLAMSVVPMSLLIMLELGVAMVQAYVFTTLMLLYQNETS